MTTLILSAVLLGILHVIFAIQSAQELTRIISIF